ncbi:MAG: isopentenyl-diphosphate Delta-isomerase [Erysipelotrichaceae bacterium]|nr:isopentenyl-diphosphate Delta-isomerase [Erysipelotrichaceae bacterium]
MADTSNPKVVTVDLQDHAQGTCEKLEAHQKAILHRAFSVFLYHDHQLLLQKRASHKYHCGGLWTNSCCSHQPDEDPINYIQKRMQEEIGASCEIEEIFSFPYYYHFSNGLTEFEYDHVYIGEYHGTFTINPEEVEQVCWIDFETLLKDVQMHPQTYTPWFIIALPKVIAEIQRRNCEK